MGWIAVTIRVALIGNPNVGKSLIFNNLTGGRVHVGNWPGKTVEKKEGRCRHRGEDIQIVDLPGVYSLTAQTIDEMIARDYIVKEKPDVVVDIVDASNLERNLYLTLQLLELEANVVVALNKYDLAKSLGFQIDVEGLSKMLGVRVIPTIATTKEGMQELLDAILEASKQRRRGSTLRYNERVEKIISRMEQLIQEDKLLAEAYPTRWLAIKVLESDEEVLKEIEKSSQKERILALKESLQKELGGDASVVLAEARYEFISGVLGKTVRGAKPLTVTDLLDKALLDKYAGIPVFLSSMWLLFRFTFDVSAPLTSLIEMFFGWLGTLASASIPNEQLAGFVVNGLLGGVGAVLTFIPPIFFLFFGLSLLEDSGYLARAAFVMDRIMYRLGLHGKSFIPLLLGFGCNVPAVMATRIIESDEDRIITILVNPLMSCSARLPVYILISSAVLGSYAAIGVYSMYLLGIALALIMALLFRRTILKGKPSPFILELPHYARPTLRNTALHMWERGSLFLKKAGTIITLTMIVVWFLSSYPWGSHLEESYVGMLGRTLEPLFRPLGFDWRAVVALFFGFLAKEVVVGTFGLLLGAEATGLPEALRSQGIFTPLTGFAFMAFTLIYMPCVATIAAIYRETNSLKWTLFAIVYSMILAYVVAFAIIIVGHLLGFA
ncbi:iron transporter FeoB [Infirmifilum uzonense]|uniref:Ferrous iron transport protein B n=1 Tax=Infirmifilum uzonense TaxID=1550241 RepID=A0A0F7CL19_9CREN|nr:iron transporter FeoB [Infirmifilum uzonense]